MERILWDIAQKNRGFCAISDLGGRIANSLDFALGISDLGLKNRIRWRRREGEVHAGSQGRRAVDAISDRHAGLNPASRCKTV